MKTDGYEINDLDQYCNQKYSELSEAEREQYGANIDALASIVSTNDAPLWRLVWFVVAFVLVGGMLLGVFLATWAVN